MLSYRGRPLFATEGPRRRVVSWPEAIAMMVTLSLILWLAVVLSCEAIR